MITHELIYLGSQKAVNEVQEIIKKAHPDAEFEDTSDFIHEYRFEVGTNDSLDELWLTALREGFALCCLGFEICYYEDRGRIQRLVEQLKGRAT